ncbi:MAG: flagellar biosynthesis protein FlhB [Alphaproteobacteria bacterium]|nr:flagellar biosynthesis protein FlhB [Alphaproteobacteria bacterium]
MAEGEDESQKTEDPTQKKLDDARKKGDVATSREVNHWFIIMALTVFMVMYAPSMMHDLKVVLFRFVEAPHLIPTDFEHLRVVFSNLFRDVMAVLVVPMVILVAVAAATGLVQHGLIFSPEKIKPKLEKISLISGFKRQFSLNAVMEFVKAVLKLLVVAGVAVFLIVPEFDNIDIISNRETTQILDLLYSLAIRLLLGVFSVVTLIALADLIYQRNQHNKKMRMSQQELKDEYKQTEGDPMIKGRLKQIRMERARRRMMAEVPEADVVITNPTHYAVALKYDQEEGMEAPLCVAKGVDNLALKIREIAEENDVAIVENQPLARALHAGMEIGDEIPEEHYKAVAEVISYVYRLKNKTLH